MSLCLITDNSHSAIKYFINTHRTVSLRIDTIIADEKVLTSEKASFVEDAHSKPGHFQLSKLDPKLIGSVLIFNSIDNLPEDANFDAFIVANEISLHEKTIKEICSYFSKRIKSNPSLRPPIIFCESPIAFTYIGITECFKSCSDLSIELICGWKTLFDSKVNATYSKLSPCSSLLIKHYNGDEWVPLTNLNKDMQNDFVFQRVLSEDLCAITYLMDNQYPVSVQATSTSTYGHGINDTIITSLEYKDGTSVLIESFRYSMEESFRITPYKSSSNEQFSKKKQEFEASLSKLTSPKDHSVSNLSQSTGLEITVEKKDYEKGFSKDDLRLKNLQNLLHQHTSWNSNDFINKSFQIPGCNHAPFNFFKDISKKQSAKLSNVPSRISSPVLLDSFSKYTRSPKKPSPSSQNDNKDSFNDFHNVSFPNICYICRGIGDVAFPEERFSLASSAQMNYLNAIIEHEDVPRIGQAVNSFIVSKLIEYCKASVASGRRLTISHTMQLAIVGSGSFSKSVQKRILSQCTSCNIAAIISKSASQLELDAVLSRNDINCVYITTPISSRSNIIRTALKYKKSVLCEQPVTDLSKLIDMAKESKQFLGIAYQRRFDQRYQRAKDFLHLLGGDLFEISIESKEPLDPVDDPLSLLTKSVVNDVDTLAWLFEELETEIKLESLVFHHQGNGITVKFSVYLQKYEKTIPAKIYYRRASKYFVQTVSVNSRKFGYNQKTTDFFEIYDDAYISLFDWVAMKVNSLGNDSDSSYTTRIANSNELFMQVLNEVRDEDSLHAVEKHVVRHATEADKKEEKRLKLLASLQPYRGVSGKGGLLTDGEKIYKPVVTDTNDWDLKKRLKQIFPSLRDFIPKLYDKIIINGIPYLSIKNITARYLKPKVLDIKIGEPSDFYKIPLQPFGLRIAGHSDEPNITHGNTSWNDILNCLKSFIKDNETGISRYEVIPHWIKRLKELQAITQNQTTFKFLGASLLFVYDATDSMPQKPAVYFANLGKTEGNKIPKYDHFFSFGLKNLIQMLADIHKKFTQRHAIFLCRHGFRIDYTDLTWVPSAEYPHDPPLSREGQRQAKDLAKRLKTENIDVIVSSPFGRAMMTAKAIAEELNVRYVVEPALAEFMSTHNRKAVPNLDPRFHQDPRIDKDYKKVGKEITLESWESMCQRATEAVTKITNKYKRVAIVSHRSTFQAFLTMITGKKFKDQLQFCSITSILPAPNEIGFTIERMNNYSHINDVVESPEHNPNYATVAYKDMIIGPDGKILPSGNV